MSMPAVITKEALQLARVALPGVRLITGTRATGALRWSFSPYVDDADVVVAVTLSTVVLSPPRRPDMRRSYRLDNGLARVGRIVEHAIHPVHLERLQALLGVRP